MKILTAIPIYNEAKYIEPVLTEVRRHTDEILVINDGSTDATPQLIAQQPDLHIVTHKRNLGYGAALRSAMHFALAHHYEVLVTMDCDGQHEPGRIPVLLEALSDDVDMVSGSRYLRTFHQDTPPPADRRRINHIITQELNEQFNLGITDAFCGFKAYRVPLLGQLRITENSWGMPLQLWVQAAAQGWRIREVAVPLLYLDPNRAFGGVLNDADQRLTYYRQIIQAETTRQANQPPRLQGCCS